MIRVLLLSTLHSGCTEVVRHCLITGESQSRSLLIIYVERSGSGAVSLLWFPPGFVFPPMLNTHQSLPTEVCDDHYEAVHYHIRSLQVEVCGLYIPVTELVWLQSKQFSYIAW